MASPMWCCNSCSPWRPSEAPFVAKSYHPLVLVFSRGLQCGGPLNQKKSRNFINSRKQPKSPPEELSEPKLSWEVFFCLFALKGSDGPLWLDQDKATRHSGVTNESCCQQELSTWSVSFYWWQQNGYLAFFSLCWKAHDLPLDSCFVWLLNKNF